MMSVTSHPEPALPATCEQPGDAISRKGHSVKFSAIHAVAVPRRDLGTAVRTAVRTALFLLQSSDSQDSTMAALRAALSLPQSSDGLYTARTDVFEVKSILRLRDKTDVKTAVLTPAILAYDVITALSLLHSSDSLDAARTDVFSAKSSLASARTAGDKTAVKTAVKTLKAAKAKVRSILRPAVSAILKYEILRKAVFTQSL